jgi:hemerythrin-like metal-binding protein
MDENQYPQGSPSDIVKAYDRFVPHQFLKLLGKKSITEVRLGDQVEKSMTVLFSDIRNFTTLSETMTPQENFNFLNSYLNQMEPVIDRHNGIIDKFVGDAIMALFPASADYALAGAVAMLRKLEEYNEGRQRAGYAPIRIGIGLNTGLLMLGVIGGANRMEGTVISDAVNLASRIESMTKNYGANILISEHTYYSLQHFNRQHIRFVDRVLVKGKMRPQSVYEVFETDPDPVRELKKKTIDLFEEAIAHYHFKKADKARELLNTYLEINPQDIPAKKYLARCERYLQTGIHEGTDELDYTVRWTPEMSIGHSAIDEQHRELFQKTNILIEIVMKGNRAAETEKAVSLLSECAVHHFRTEEDLMRQHEYPFLDIQEQQHDRFVRSFAKLKEEIPKFKGNQLYLMFRIKIFIVDWLVNHTTKEDMHLGQFIQREKA